MILHRTALIFASMIAKGNCSNVFCQHDMMMNVCLVVCTKAFKIRKVVIEEWLAVSSS
jgi:hypothetical protein